MDSNSKRRDFYLEFKSCSTYTDSIDDLRIYTKSYFNCNQRSWIRRTPTVKRSEWCKGDLQSVRIDVTNIDRLYHLSSTSLEMEMIARMRYKDQLLYIHVLVNTEVCGVRCCGGGIIYIGRDVNTFMHQVLCSGLYQKDAICELLAEDGIALDIDALIAVDEEARDRYHLQIYSNIVPTLEYLCKKSMYRKRMQPDRLGLPRIIEKDYADFINFKDIDIMTCTKAKIKKSYFLLRTHIVY